MTKEEAQRVLTGLIQKEMVILGPSVALSRARNVSGFTVQEDGKVTEISGDPRAILSAVADEFILLTGDVTKTIVNSLVDRSE